MPQPLHVVILAAGAGTRMKSTLPKVLQKVAGKPMLGHVIDTAHSLHAEAIHVVYGHEGNRSLMPSRSSRICAGPNRKNVWVPAMPCSK